MFWQIFGLAVVFGIPAIRLLLWLYVVLRKGTVYWEERFCQFLEDREAARFAGITVAELRISRKMERMRRDGIL